MNRFLSTIAVIFLFQNCFFAQNLPVVTISSFEECKDYALKNNPDLETYLLNIEKAKSDSKTAFSLVLPSVSGNFSTQVNTKLAATPFPGEIFGKPGQTIDVQFGQKYNFNAGLNVAQNLIDWQNIIQIQITKNFVRTNELQSDAFKQSLIQQAALYYYSTIISQEALSTYSLNLSIADSNVYFANQKFNQGLINAITKNQSIINRNAIVIQIANTELLINQGKTFLKILLGIQPNFDLKLQGENLKNKQNLSLTGNIGRDKTLDVFKNQVDGANLKKSFARSAFLPKLSMNYYYGYQQYRNDFGMSLSTDAWRPVSYVGLNLHLPIFSGFSNYNKLESADIELRASEITLSERVRKSAVNDDLLIYEFEKSKESVIPALSNLKLNEENRILAQQQVKEGVISMDVYFKIFDDYLKSENIYLNALSVLYTHYSTILSRQ